MTPPFLQPPSAAFEFVRCASGCDSWAPHHVRLDGDLCRLCSSCVLLSNPDAHCSVCLFLLSPSAYAAASHEAHVDFSPGPTARCSSCSTFLAHVSCIADPYSFVCPPCAAAIDETPFSYDLDETALDGRSARILVTADTALRHTAAAREKAERSVQEAAAARAQARAMLDAAFSAAEAEACRDAEEQVTPSAPAVEQVAPSAPEVEWINNRKTPQRNGPKKKTPESNELNKLLKFNDMQQQQPALAFATVAAAAAGPRSLPMPSSRLVQNHQVKQEAMPLPVPVPSSRLVQNHQVKQEAMPLPVPVPSSRLVQNHHVKQEAGGSVDTGPRGDYRELFGTLQW